MCTGPRESLRDRLRDQAGALTARDLHDVEDVLLRQSRGETITAREAALIARVIDEDPYAYQRGRQVAERGAPVYAASLDAGGAPGRWVEVGALGERARFEYTPDPTEYDFYEVDADGNYVITGDPATLYGPTPAAVESRSESEGPAASHLSSDASRSAYAAAGALRDAGSARDDDLAWPDDWSWGRPAPMLSSAPDGWDGTHWPVAAPGTIPADGGDALYLADGPPDDEDDDAPYPGAFPPAIERVASAVGALDVPFAEAFRAWTATVERVMSAMGIPRAMVEGTAADPIAGNRTGSPTGILLASSPDDPNPRRVTGRMTDAPGGGWQWTNTEPVVWAGSPMVDVVYDEVAPWISAGVWDAAIEPVPLVVSAAEAAAQVEPLAPEFRLDRPRIVDTAPQVTVAVDLGTRDASLVAALRNGEVVEVTGRGWRNVADAVYGARVFRPDRLFIGPVA